MKSFKAILLILLLIVTISESSYSFERYNRVKKYDPHFRKYTKRFFGPAFDWLHFKAQAVAESRLKKDAESSVGAKGLMQIMPETFEEIKRKSRYLEGTRVQPRWNIAAGIWYDWSLWKLWSDERPFQDRLDFVFGSYNAGKGNILKAQEIAEKRGVNPNLWKSIEKYIHFITGKKSRETIGYVKKIKKIKGVLVE